MSYEFTIEGQNKIIFEQALAEAKILLDCALENYNNQIELAPDDSSGEETLADSLQFFQNLYNRLFSFQNYIILTNEDYFDLNKNYKGYKNNIDTFLDSFQEIKNK